MGCFLLADVRGRLKTTVIGSFPLDYTEENMAKALTDQVQVGIDYPSPPQLLDMNLMFLEPLAKQGCGVEIRGEEAWLVGTPSPPQQPVATEDLVWSINYLRERGLLDKIDGFKVPITGPITLASVTKISQDTYAIMYEDVVMAFAEVVKKIVEFFREAGAALITIDEPTIPYALWLGLSEDTIIRVVNKALEGAGDAITSLHVCGDISGVGKLCLQINVDILSHEFRGTPKNLTEYTKSDLEKADKLIGLGCVLTKPIEVELPVESVEDIKSFIEKAADRFGAENLAIMPDCGFGSLKLYYKSQEEAQAVVRKKLENMCVAVRELRKKWGFPSD